MKNERRTREDRWGYDAEFFAIGSITPTQTQAEKTNNDVYVASELSYYNKRGVHCVANFFSNLPDAVPYREVPNPNGIWRDSPLAIND